MYGHPAAEAQERLLAAGVKLFRNDTDGALSFWIKNGKIKRISGCASRVA
jgi:beta-lactamase superfamily II metal-dependent hydrolase